MNTGSKEEFFLVALNREARREGGKEAEFLQKLQSCDGVRIVEPGYGGSSYTVSMTRETSEQVKEVLPYATVEVAQESELGLKDELTRRL